MVPVTRGSWGGKKPTVGMRSALASSFADPYAWVNAPKWGSKPFSQTSLQISSRMARHLSIGPSRSNFSALRILRS